MTTGFDLVRDQVLIASGERLAYAQSDICQTGHALECRIYAEVPEENFRPATGTIEVFEPPSGPGIRLDSGVGPGSVISYHFDPLLAKLIAWGPSRRAAIDRMKRALDDFVLLGVRNNIEFLRRVISTDEFGAGKLDTTFLDRHTEVFNVPKEPSVEALLVASIAESTYQPTYSPQQSFTDVWNSGPWRNS